MFKTGVWWLLLAGIVFLSFSVYWRKQTIRPDADSIVRSIESNLNNQLNNIQADGSKILQALNDNREWPPSPFVFHAYDSTGLVKWNSDKPVPEVSIIDSVSILQQGNTYFLAKQFKSEQHTVIGFLWLQKHYTIQNRYLKNEVNAVIFPNQGIVIESGPNANPVKLNGKQIFSISNSLRADADHFLPFVGWLALLVGSVCWLFAIWQIAFRIKQNGLPVIGAVLVFLALLSVRFVMVYGGYPGVLNTSNAFNPTQFASSTFNDSIGNFFLNTLAFMAAGWVMYSWVVREQIAFRSERKVPQLIMSLLYLLLAFGFHLLPFLYLETIFHNSAISLDITRQLYFDPVRWLALATFLFSVLTAYFYFHAFFRLVVFTVGKKVVYLLVMTCLAALLLYTYHIATERQYLIPIIVCSLHVFVLVLVMWFKQFKQFQSKVFAVAFLAVLLFSLQGALTIRMLTQERDVRAMKRYANSFLVERDVLAEFLLTRSAAAIAQDVFIQQQFSHAFGRLDGITHKILRTHLSSYFDRYSIDIRLYDGKGNVINHDGLPLDSIRKQYKPVDGLDAPLFIGKNARATQNSYWMVVPIHALVPGFIGISVTLREVSPVTVFPRLLLDDRFSHYAHQNDFSYAIYSNGRVQHTAGNFQYQLHGMQRELANPQLFRTGLLKADYFHLALEDIDGRVALVSTKPYTAFNTITNFSFLFLTGLLVCVLVLVISYGLSKRSTPLPYSVRIQLYVYVALVLPATIIAVTTLRLNASSDFEHSESENMEKARLLAQNLEMLTQSGSTSLQEQLQARVRALGVDATLFSSGGKLLAASQPEIYSNYILGSLLKPSVLEEISKGNLLFTRQDRVDNLTFRTTYATLRAADGNLSRAVLAVPFFGAQQDAEDDQLRLAANFLVVLALVFLLFYLASFLALSWLTKPLLVISSTLRKTTLTGTNRKLSWHSSDEIGDMVTEYNKMIDNLETSKAELARKQREDAWREMARQVAHEIKNPLTPIKLTLQQMEFNINAGKESHDKNKQYIRTVLHQVDILNEIASSFSAFAQMPALKLERSQLQVIIQETADLYSQTAPHRILLSLLEKPIAVMADRKMFGRIFGNIILNAFQSGGGDAITVTIHMQLNNNEVLIILLIMVRVCCLKLLIRYLFPISALKKQALALGWQLRVKVLSRLVDVFGASQRLAAALPFT
jgi:two-component system, NtrC family, nitrogen regulation sensor histidine kinase NtrY